MLDVETLQVALAIVTLSVLTLFYLGVYRPTQSPFSGWWALALVCAAASSTLLLADGTAAQVVTNPASTAVSATAATSVWFAARSLRSRSLPLWVLAVAPLACVSVAAFDSPSTNAWAGNSALYAVMSAGFAGGAYEVWGAWARRRSEPDRRLSGEAITALWVSAFAATVLATLYAARFVVFMVVGPHHPVFTAYVGTVTTTLVLLLCLVAVTFSVSAIGWDQRTRELRRQATQDDLTGLLGRTAFLRRAQEALASAGGRRSRRAWLVIADLDDFKPINDEFGHQAGDRTLQHFARLTTEALRSSDAVGRLGGDEFGIVFEGVELDVALARLDAIRAGLAASADVSGRPMPTVSFGVAECASDLTLSDVLGHADTALYEAKRAGRNRSSVFEGAPGVR